LAAAALATVLIASGANGSPGRTNGRIAFVRSLPQGSYAVFTMAPNGHGARRVTWNALGLADFAPAWSFDGRRLAFTRNAPPAPGETSFQRSIWIASATGAGAKDFYAQGIASAWAPPGDRLAVEQPLPNFGIPEKMNLVVVSVRNGNSTALGRGHDPAWSPRGGAIAFSAGSIAVADLGTHQMPRWVTAPPKQAYDESPSWSPNGDRLAFTRIVCRGSEPCQSSIFVSSSLGERLRRIARNASDPSWSPDGRKIAFVRNLDGDDEVFVMDANGKHQKRLTRHAGADVQPAWQPLPR
jgi:TolB protein